MTGLGYTGADYASAMDQGNYDKAITIMTDIIKGTDTKSGELYYKRASAYAKKGDFVYAVIDCGTALTYSPGEEKYFLLRGECKKQINDPTYVSDLRNAGPKGLALLNEKPAAAKPSVPIAHTVQNKANQSGPSDVDVNIPVVRHKNPNTFVLIFCNENYLEDGISNVNYAHNDGNKFKEYCIKTLGIPVQNIHLRADATRNQFRSEIKWARNISDAYGNDADLILYYSGHGMPDDRSRKAYLLPSDGIANDPESGYALSQLYDELGEMKFNSTLVLLDACFSGAKRDGKMLTAAKGVAIKPSEEELSGNVAVISATQGDDTAYPDDDSRHGLFTYFLLKRLQETKGYTTIGDLASYISTNVKRASLVKQNKMQVPAVNYSPESSVDLEIVNFGQK
ncbi:MAG: caspase family protein [Muribaculaceae bacterium]|nr:caspase family protein [Muribaculaceae bacterium]